MLTGGEEHSLLATSLPATCRGWRRIGSVRAVGPGERAGVLVDGRPRSHSGWDHFRPD